MRTRSTGNRTTRAVESQIEAMGCDVFEIGLFKIDAAEGESIMVPRVWDREALVRSVPWLRHENLGARNIYIRPKGEHQLSLVDDLSASAVANMKRSGFAPALVVETSPGNFQAWVKHSECLDKETGTAAARELAQRFGGDTKAADWRHFGRLAGFTNRKSKYRDAATGLYPFVKIIEATGTVYSEADEFIRGVHAGVEERKHAEELRRAATSKGLGHGDVGPLKSIESFRSDPRYAGDGSRIDLAYALYAFSRGSSQAQVEAAIASRDLSHKGTERRQRDYIARTVRKALATVDRGHER